MQYCEFVSDLFTLRKIESILYTPQQKQIFKLYITGIKEKKHYNSYIDYYRSYIEKYRISPDINMDLYEDLSVLQPCSQYSR